MFVAGHSKETAQGLLGAAEGLDFDPSVVVVVNGGFEAPDEVVEAFQALGEKPKTKTTSKAKASTAKKKEGEN